ncbi:pectinesterase family protein [Sinomicrobium weinanense]|uniref:pectinesterase family protein n=1 Tax=Sinomicrobium weinanense TaxID=2842200 RepID=UPI0024959251|nr:pectinesterase family protein [Sinomicrobium weinanense]
MNSFKTKYGLAAVLLLWCIFFVQGASGNKVYDFVVDQSGKGDFTTVQEAINAVPDFRKKETKIFIKNGKYKEKLVLPVSKTNVTFIGESMTYTILTFDDYASKKNIFGEEMGLRGLHPFLFLQTISRLGILPFRTVPGLLVRRWP